MFEKFRFQTGSIKRQQVAIISSISAMFRFQTGSIKSTFTVRSLNVRSEFRFQTGSIKSEEGVLVEEFYDEVSIPNWFD